MNPGEMHRTTWLFLERHEEWTNNGTKERSVSSSDKERESIYKERIKTGSFSYTRGVVTVCI